MKKFILFLAMVGLALWCGSCARLREIPPEAPPPAAKPECDPAQLRQDLAQEEMALTQNSGEKPNSLIRLARLCFLLGELSPKGEKQQYFEKGLSYAKTLAKEQPAWAEGHYWLALNLCGLAEMGGARQGLKLLSHIVAELEQALKVNQAYDQAGAHRVLGRIYYEAPMWPLSVGDIHKSLHHLSAAVAIEPDNTTNHLYLAETLFKLGKKAEARKELDLVLRSTRHALCPEDLEQDRREALRLLKESR